MSDKNYKLHQSDIPNKNGHIYPKEEFEKALELHKAHDGLIWVQLYPTPDKFHRTYVPHVDLDKVCATVKKDSIKISETGEVTGDVNFLETRYGFMITDMIEKGLTPEFGVIGFGNMTPDKVIQNFSLVSFGIEMSGE